MSDITSPEPEESEKADERADARRWNNRPELRLEDDFTRGGGSPQPTPQPAPEPSRNPDRDWGGGVLAAAGTVVLMLATVIVFSVVMGGLVGLLTVAEAVALTVLLAVLGALRVYRGRPIYQGGEVVAAERQVFAARGPHTIPSEWTSRPPRRRPSSISLRVTSTAVPKASNGSS